MMLLFALSALAAPPAVVELFTSEGCSSCPPADKLLAELADDDVIVLGWHVDYWDRLGWKDPFGSAAYTERQQQYVRALGARGLYTPQAVVNGRDETVGSNSAVIKMFLMKALVEPASGTIAATATWTDRGVEVSAKGSGLPDGVTLEAVLVQNSAATSVTKGENKGRTLRHVGIVRAVAQVSDDSARLQTDAALDPAASSVVVLARNASLEVVAATRVALSRG